MASLVSSIDLLQQLDTQRKRLSYSIVALLWKRYTFRIGLTQGQANNQHRNGTPLDCTEDELHASLVDHKRTWEQLLIVRSFISSKSKRPRRDGRLNVATPTTAHSALTESSQPRREVV